MDLTSHPLHKDGVRELLLDPEACGTPLMVVILRTLGADAIHDDPLVTYGALNAEYDVWMTEEGENRYEALNLAFTTDLFYTDFDAWMSVVSVLYEGTMQDLRLIEAGDLTVPEVLWAHYEVDLIRDHVDEAGRPVDITWSPSIRRFIESLVIQEAEAPDTPDDPEFVVPYYLRFLDAQKRKLVDQLNLIGLPVSMTDLPALEEPEALETA